MKRNGITLAVALLVAICTQASASIVFPDMNPILRNFDGMHSSGTVSLTATPGVHNALAGSGGFEGTKVSGTGSTLNFLADDGTSNSGRLGSLGTTASSERALGSLGSGSTIPAFGAEIINNSGFAWTSVDLDFRREVWRSSTSTQNILVFGWGVTGGGASSSDYLTHASLAALATCDLVGEPPIPSPGTNGPEDGNADAVNVSCTIPSAVPNGSSLFIRWTDTNDLGNDAAVAIDDLTITPTPEPATMTLLALGGLALIRRRR